MHDCAGSAVDPGVGIVPQLGTTTDLLHSIDPVLWVHGLISNYPGTDKVRLGSLLC